MLAGRFHELLELYGRLVLSLLLGGFLVVEQRPDAPGQRRPGGGLVAGVLLLGARRTLVGRSLSLEVRAVGDQVVRLVVDRAVFAGGGGVPASGSVKGPEPGPQLASPPAHRVNMGRSPPVRSVGLPQERSWLAAWSMATTSLRMVPT